jgi:hypothetical protein
MRRHAHLRLISAVAFASVITTVAAQTSSGSVRSAQSPSKSALSVSPAVIERVLDPGVPAEAPIMLTNVTDFALPIKASVRSFLTQEEVDEKHRAAYDASEWFRIGEADFVLQPRERRQVSINIAAPGDAEPGGHYATVLLEPMIPSQALSPQNASLSARVGVLSFLIVKGDIVERVAPVGGLRTAGFSQSGPVEFKVTLRNEGNVHVLPTGHIDVLDWRNKRVGRAKLVSRVLMPGTSKEFRAHWNKEWPIGRFRGVAHFVYSAERSELKIKPATFWVVPGVTLLPIAVLTTVLLLLRVRRRRGLRLATPEPGVAADTRPSAS